MQAQQCGRVACYVARGVRIQSAVCSTASMTPSLYLKPVDIQGTGRDHCTGANVCAQQLPPPLVVMRGPQGREWVGGPRQHGVGHDNEPSSNTPIHVVGRLQASNSRPFRPGLQRNSHMRQLATGKYTGVLSGVGHESMPVMHLHDDQGGWLLAPGSSMQQPPWPLRPPGVWLAEPLGRPQWQWVEHPFTLPHFRVSGSATDCVVLTAGRAGFGLKFGGSGLWGLGYLNRRERDRNRRCHECRDAPVMHP